MTVGKVFEIRWTFFPITALSFAGAVLLDGPPHKVCVTAIRGFVVLKVPSLAALRLGHTRIGVGRPSHTVARLRIRLILTSAARSVRYHGGPKRRWHGLLVFCQIPASTEGLNRHRHCRRSPAGPGAARPPLLPTPTRAAVLSIPRAAECRRRRGAFAARRVVA